MRVKNVIAVGSFVAFGLIALPSKGQAVEQSPTRTMITTAEKILEDRQHAARKEIAERWTARLYAALDQTLKSVAEQTGQNPGQTAKNPGKSSAIAAAEARPENRLQVAPAQPAAPAMADLSDDARKDANRIIAGQPTLEQTIASARAEQAARNSTGAGADALDDPQPGARLPMAQRTKAGLAQGGKEEADRIIADLDKSLQDYAVAAAAERTRIAQKETAGQPKSEVGAPQGPPPEDRPQHASESAAQKTTAELGQGGREASDRIVTTLDKTLPADAAAERDKVAQSDAKRQATATLQATSATTRARQREEANRIVADLNETLQARAAAERLQLAQTDAKNREAAAVQAADAKARAAQREEARRIVADLDRALHAAAAKKRDRIAGTEAVSQAKTARIADGTKKVKRAAVAKAESKTENHLHAARLDDAQPTPEGTFDQQNLGAPSEAPNPLPADAPAQQAPPPATAGVDAPNQGAATGELGADPQNNQGYAGRASRAARSGASSVASANGPDKSLRRLCPSILANASEYEDRLVGLCRTWADGH